MMCARARACVCTCLERLQHRHFINKILVHFTLPVSGFEDDASKGLPIHGPERTERNGFDRGRSGHIVKKS